MALSAAKCHQLLMKKYFLAYNSFLTWLTISQKHINLQSNESIQNYYIESFYKYICTSSNKNLYFFI